MANGRPGLSRQEFMTEYSAIKAVLVEACYQAGRALVEMMRVIRSWERGDCLYVALREEAASLAQEARQKVKAVEHFANRRPLERNEKRRTS